MYAKQRNIGLAILFTIITCGIYGIFWFISLTDDVNSMLGGENTSGGMAFVLTLVTCGIYRYFWSYKMGERIEELKRRHNMTVSSGTSVIYLLLSLFGLDIVAWALLQSDLNTMLPGNESTM